MTTLGRPDASEYAPYYARYISLVPEGEILPILVRQRDATAALLGGLTEAQGEHRYAPGKWSIKELVCHVADTERVFSYRALHFSRADPAPLPSMDQEVWARGVDLTGRTLRSLADELTVVRAASIALVASLTPAQAVRRGIASNNEVSVRALAFLLAGHQEHHLRVLKERYLDH